MIDDLLRNLNDDERFYRAYFEAGRRPDTLQKFLKGVDIDDARRRRLIIPELLPENISYQMNDDEYFSPDDPRNVFISPHNRYTPAFTMVAECRRAEVGVGATMAPRSQVWKGICAAFVRPASARQASGTAASAGCSTPN